jgi:serine/threonine protein kinase
LDESELKLGDSLRQKIDQGLAESSYGVVILSRNFFSKDWAQRELNALASLETNQRKVILPVLDDLDHQSISNYSPLLADKIAISTDRGLNQVALEILKVVGPSALTDKKQWDQIIGQGPDKAAAAHTFDNPETLVGHSVDSYDLLEFIGSGGSGIVFRAVQRSLGRRVALKILYPLPLPAGNFVQLFKRSFRALGALNHPNIVAISEFGEARIANASTFFIAMEYVQGESLQTWSNNLDKDRDAFVKRLRCAIKLSEALNAAHQTAYSDELGFEVRGVLHGDIKPSNVLVSQDGEIKLLDFLLVDIQRLLDPRVIPPHFITSEMPITAACGTPGFMAPEQERDGVVTVQTDIFGLGITFCYLFCPDDSGSPISFFRNNNIPEALRVFTMQMIAPSPKERPQNMNQVLETLQKIQNAYAGKGISNWWPVRWLQRKT